MSVVRQAAQIHVGGQCELDCALCDCRNPATSEEVTRRLLADGDRPVMFRGACSTSPRLASLLGQAKEAGFQEVIVRTHALPYVESRRALELSAQGVTTALVPLFSHHPKVHDRVAGKPGALAQTLAGMRALAAAGLAIEIEVPLLSPRVQDVVALVDLAHRAVPTLRAAHFRLPAGQVSKTLVAPAWDEASPLLAQALERCAELGIKTVLRSPDLIPFCALTDYPEHLKRFWFNPKAKRKPTKGASRPPVCQRCVARHQCAGVAESYLDAHGERGLVPLTTRPRELYEQRTTPSRVWTNEERQAARDSMNLVLRPTINCNQDCTFCSANETSGNIWQEKKTMLQAIARAARRGVDWVSFSGGEPTLSKDLAGYVRTARRVGIKNIELVTNAVLLDSPKRVTALVEAGVTHAFVSLHAHNDEISKWMTQKVGDWQRTVRGIELLLDAGVRVRVNHVISARNYRFLRRFVAFVHERFNGRVSISFAFVTPQYKALENIEVVPQLSEVMTYLRPALHLAVSVRQPFIVGSRQGIPPCFLGEFQAWSDILNRSNEAKSIDGPQKQRAAGCDDCRYGDVCTGLWKPYVARYGLDELRPLPGPRLQPNDPRVRLPDLLRSFEDVSEMQRDRNAEREGQEALARIQSGQEPSLPEPLSDTFSLPVFSVSRSRPLRVVLAGTGGRARRLAAAARKVTGLSIDALASPHALDVDRSDFDPCPVYSDAVEAMEDIRPEAVIIAAATHAHFELAQAALSRGIPVLVEKPVTRTDEETLELIRLRNEHDVPLVPAHNVLHAPGVAAVLEAENTRSFSYTRRCPPTSPEAPRTWRRQPLYEMLYHALTLVGRACGGGVPVASNVRWEGGSRPERIRLRLTYERCEADLQFDFTSTQDVLFLVAQAQGGEVVWRREGRDTTLSVAGTPRTIERDGSDVERMLRRFRDTVLGDAAPAASAEEGLDIMRAARAVVDALEAANAPLDRQNAPKHVASRSLSGAARH